MFNARIIEDKRNVVKHKFILESVEIDKGGSGAQVDPHIGGEHPDHAVKIFCQLAHHSQCPRQRRCKLFMW